MLSFLFVMDSLTSTDRCAHGQMYPRTDVSACSAQYFHWQMCPCTHSDVSITKTAPLSLSCHVMSFCEWTMSRSGIVTSRRHIGRTACLHLNSVILLLTVFCWDWQLNGRSFSCCGRQHRYVKCPLGVCKRMLCSIITVRKSRVLWEFPRSGELRTQKFKSRMVRTQSLNVLPLKPGVGQYISRHATPTARDFLLAYFYPSGPFTCILSKTSPDFFSCVGCG